MLPQYEKRWVVMDPEQEDLGLVCFARPIAPGYHQCRVALRRKQRLIKILVEGTLRTDDVTFTAKPE